MDIYRYIVGFCRHKPAKSLVNLGYFSYLCSVLSRYDMAKVIQLFFDFAPEASPRVPQETSPVSAGIKSLNPCPSCEYNGMCDSDECAAQLYLLDSPYPATRFRNLAEFINFKKQHGWL